MLGRALLLDHVGHLRLACHGALDGELGGFVVVVLDLSVVFSQPVNEDADADEQVIGFFRGDGAVLDAIGHGRMATPRCAGTNICTACLPYLMVTLLNMTVDGLHSRLGATTASRLVKPSLLLVRQLANADSAALSRGPMIRSM